MADSKTHHEPNTTVHTTKHHREPNATVPTTKNLYVITSDENIADIQRKVNEFATSWLKRKNGKGGRIDKLVSPIHEISIRPKKINGHIRPLIVTDSNLVLLRADIATDMMNLSDFPYYDSIKPYCMNVKSDVLPEGCRGLHLSVPRNFKSDYITAGITLVMDILVKFHVIPANSYTINIVGHDRVTGLNSGSGVNVMFNDDAKIDDESISIARVYMHNLFWHLTPTCWAVDVKGNGAEVKNYKMLVEFHNPHHVRSEHGHKTTVGTRQPSEHRQLTDQHQPFNATPFQPSFKPRGNKTGNYRKPETKQRGSRKTPSPTKSVEVDVTGIDPVVLKEAITLGATFEFPEQAAVEEEN